MSPGGDGKVTFDTSARGAIPGINRLGMPFESHLPGWRLGSDNATGLFCDQDSVVQDQAFSSDAGQPKRATLEGLALFRLKSTQNKSEKHTGLSRSHCTAVTGAQTLPDGHLVRFDGIRDAQKAVDTIVDNVNDADVSYLDPNAVARIRGFPDAKISIFGGRVALGIM
ncbi:uncharacterized protein AB675_10452 [Cyphellophora attinorum]|uniref:Uncharacterized protein n=1 Tax=Cyphellophora attinorum TaxID=1664694 RepID=A0A0N1NYE9_9EURO|nr:uncharacterized protein AB675_10452 [Phialophora attinorum]KPI35930.1 hypothetical protein AB675_10452 [Phialophora attinorum]